jgi:hypothetical protein
LTDHLHWEVRYLSDNQRENQSEGYVSLEVEQLGEERVVQLAGSRKEEPQTGDWREQTYAWNQFAQALPDVKIKNGQEWSAFSNKHRYNHKGESKGKRSISEGGPKRV